MCVLSRFSRVRICATLWTAGHQAPLSMGFSRPRVLEWVAIAFSIRCSYHEIITIIIKMMGGNLGRRWKCHALSFIILSVPRFLQTSGQLLSLRANPGISHAWNPFNHYWKKFQEEEGNVSSIPPKSCWIKQTVSLHHHKLLHKWDGENINKLISLILLLSVENSA